MPDEGGFLEFKGKMIKDYELDYENEARSKHGDCAVERSKAMFGGMSREQRAQAENFRKGYESALKEAFAQGAPEGPLAPKACELHRKWLCLFYHHNSLTQMCVDDPRFKA
jgi:hypothetical protein